MTDIGHTVCSMAPLLGLMIPMAYVQNIAKVCVFAHMFETRKNSFQKRATFPEFFSFFHGKVSQYWFETKDCRNEQSFNFLLTVSDSVGAKSSKCAFPTFLIRS